MDDSPREWAIFVLKIVFALFALLLVVIWAAVKASAHDAPSGMVYDGWCCNGNRHTGDCAPIPASAVTYRGDGWVIHLGQGDHLKVTQPHEYFVPQGTERRSTDGEYHACLYPSENDIRCLFVPSQGS